MTRMHEKTVGNNLCCYLRTNLLQFPASTFTVALYSTTGLKLAWKTSVPGLSCKDERLRGEQLTLPSSAIPASLCILCYCLSTRSLVTSDCCGTCRGRPPVLSGSTTASLFALLAGRALSPVLALERWTRASPS